jgi:SPX domain protein involved in polyphosphate accumulation
VLARDIVAGVCKSGNMKFGRNLPRNQVPEWASSYINYKGLKKLIKTAAEASNESSELDLAGRVSVSEGD